MPTPSGRRVGPGEDGYDVVPGVQKGIEGLHGDLGGASEDEAHAVGLADA
jgi:hypothetical protein